MSRLQAISVMIKPVSGLCNMRCRYCFYADELHHRGQALPPMSTDTLEKVVRRVMRSAERAVHFVFQGGEPTLIGLDYYRKAIEFQQRYAHPGQIVTNALQTNGLCIPEAMMRFFATHHFLLGVSLDGDAQTHDLFRLDAQGGGTFARIRETLSSMEALGVEYNILCVVNEAVARHAEQVLDALVPYRFLQFIPCLDPLDGTRNDFSLTEQRYLSFLKRAFDRYAQAFYQGMPFSVRMFDNWISLLMGRGAENCAMLGRCSANLMVESNGDVYPCDFYGLDAWKLGNLRDHSLGGMLQGEVLGRFIEESLPVPERCRACRWYPLCRNGCKRERDARTGIQRWCRVYQDFFAYALADMEQIARRMQGA